MEYTGGEYRGTKVMGKFDGKDCTFTFENGTVYNGGFKNGEFHGEGSLTIPGFGTYNATWVHGKEVKGGYTFKDGLKYIDENWKYCAKKDRRFFSEITEGIKPAGKSIMSSNQQIIPFGCYDAGDGYYDPNRKAVCAFDNGLLIRTPNQFETTQILNLNRTSEK